MWLKNNWKRIQKGIRYPFTIIFAIPSWLTNNHSLVLALATIALVFVTFFHMREAGNQLKEAEKLRGEIKRFADSTAGQLKEAENMRGETKRLADTTVRQLEESKKLRVINKKMADLMVEQFKIRSYPTFLVIPERPIVENGKLAQKFTIHNQGEITAFNVSTQLMNIYQAISRGFSLIYPASDSFLHIDSSPAYEYQGVKTQSDLEFDIPRGSHLIYTNQGSFPPGRTIINLDKSILFIKFKVPYDDKFSYRVSCFSMQTNITADKKETHTWTQMDSRDANKLIKESLGRIDLIPGAWKIKAKFFEDYKLK